VPVSLRLTAPSSITRVQHRAQEPQEPAAADPVLDRLHQPVVRDRLETRGDVFGMKARRAGSAR
jgi:hypothetical protein